MSDMITVHLSQEEAMFLGLMMKVASDELMEQIAQLDQDQREFLATLQRIMKQFPAVAA